MRIPFLPMLIALTAACLQAFALTLDEAPAGEGEWGYRPADGTEPAMNPPGFTWRPTKDAASYVLQAASGAAFDSIVYEARDIPWTAHCPSETLPHGKHFWRYAALDADGAQSAWSQIRSFTVSADAVAAPQPPVAELIARMPQGHPRLLFREEDVPRFRELAQGPLAAEYKSVIDAADKMLAEPPDTSEPPKYPPDVVRPSAEWKKMWWGNRVRMIQVTDGAASLAFAYRMTGDEKYARAARNLLMAFAEWDPKGSTNYRYNDEAAMPALYYASRAYTWAWPVLSADDRAKVVAVMRVRGQDCFDSLRGSPHLWRPYNSHHNRAWHWLGELAIAFHGDIPEAEKWLDYAMTIMYTTYPVWNDDDGGWHEGMAYWSSYVSRFMYWADAVRSAFGIDVFKWPYFAKAGDFGMYLMPPGTQHGGFADQTTTMKSESIGGLMAVLAAGARNPCWKWYADTVGGTLGGGYAGFIRAAHSVDLDGRPPADLPTSVCFRGVGLAVLNTDLVDGARNVQVHFKSSPFFGTQSHGYNANNAFLLNLRGRPVFVRSGRRDIYGSPHHKDWMWHTQSDNAILVNGESQYKHSSRAKGRIIAFETSPTVDVVAGEAGAAYENLNRWTRRIIFLKPHAILIHDILEAPEPSGYQWMLHTPGQFELGEQHASWEGQPGRVDVSFLYPGNLSITQTGEYDPPPAEWTKWDLGEWHLTAQPESKAKRQEFLTLITIDNAPVELVAPESAGECPHYVTLALPEGLAEITLDDESFAVEAPGFSGEFGQD